MQHIIVCTDVIDKDLAIYKIFVDGNIMSEVPNICYHTY